MFVNECRGLVYRNSFSVWLREWLQEGRGGCSEDRGGCQRVGVADFSLDLGLRLLYSNQPKNVMEHSMGFYVLLWYSTVFYFLPSASI